MKKDPALNILRITALVVVIAGALASLGWMFNAGRNQSSVLLIMLFTIWVLSPFAALMITHVISKRWPVLPRLILYFSMIVLTIISLVFYSGILSFPGTKTAFVFLVIPLASWIFIAIIIAIGRSLSRRNNVVDHAPMT